MSGDEETKHDFYRAWATLTRLQWLVEHGCLFSCDVQAEIAKRRPLAPTWRPEHAKDVTRSREPQSGWVATVTDHRALLNEPIDSILSRARELSGRAEGNFFEERDPFAGLCAERPVRAYRALLNAARKGEFPEWAWNTFLTSKARESDRLRFSAAIALRLCQFPTAHLSKLQYPSAWWLQKSGKTLSGNFPKAFDGVTARLIDAVEFDRSESRSALLEVRKSRDWATAALNSPVGHIAMAILDDQRLEKIVPGANDSADWLSPLKRLLDLTGDTRRHAIAMISHNLDWLHHIVQKWTEDHLLSIVDSADVDDRAAFWAGFFWNPRISSADLYLRLKPGLLSLTKERDSSREVYLQSLAYLICVGWAVTLKNDGTRAVSNTEFREALLDGGDDFRTHVLWQFERTLAGVQSSSVEEWVARARDFFLQVWPRQKSVKSPRMTIGLVRLLVSNVDAFTRMASVIMPLLTKIEKGDSFHFRPEFDQVLKSHPEPLLGVLHTVFPDDSSEWPYGCGELIEQIGEADSTLLSDPRLQELKRKWNAR
jgi:hypothetical protein